MPPDFSQLKGLTRESLSLARRESFNDDAQKLTERLGGNFRNGIGYINCPVCGDGRQVKPGQKHNATLRRADRGGLLFRCYSNGCSFESFLDAVERRGIDTGKAANSPPMTQAEIAARDAQEAKRQARTKANVHAALAGTTPITPGDPVWLYLTSRGITPEAIAEANRVGDLMHRPNLLWGYDDASKQNLHFPSMVARIRTPEGEAVHRTYLDDQGRKAPALPNRKMLGRATGGSVTLANRPGGKILVCEGIETGLSLTSGLAPDFGAVFATLSTTIMQAGVLPIPASDTREIVIFSDGDRPGRDAANKAVTNLMRMRPQNPTKIYSAPDGQDFNDVLITELRKRGMIE